MLNLRITHEHWGSSSDPSLNGQLHYPTDLDKIQNEDPSGSDKILQYRVDYNNRPSHVIFFMPVVASTSGHLHCELVSFLFLQVHRETDRFLTVSGVQLVCKPFKH